MERRCSTESRSGEESVSTNDFVEVELPDMPKESQNVLTEFLVERETQTESVTKIADNAPIRVVLNKIDADMSNEQELNSTGPKKNS